MCFAHSSFNFVNLILFDIINVSKSIFFMAHFASFLITNDGLFIISVSILFFNFIKFSAPS